MSNEQSIITDLKKIENILDNDIIVILCAILAFAICLGLVWQRYQSKNTIDDKGME
jgi:predicted negative regulator of RcsB-dependent stress response